MVHLTGWIGRLASCVLLTSATLSLCSAALRVYDLRCDWMTNPLGVDSTPPQLAWKLESNERGARQSAYEIRAATSAEKLAHNDADLWDSGKVPSEAQLQIAFGGRPLKTAEQVYWQVRAWDQHDVPSDWSTPASWTTGISQPADWSAQWITDPALEQKTRRFLGFSTPAYENAETAAWIAIDLGRAEPVDEVVLQALVHTVPERLGFPQWFRLELANRPDFSDAQVVADHTHDPINPWLNRIAIPVQHVSARYVRVFAPQLRTLPDDAVGGTRGRLALRQIEIKSGERNVALDTHVTASASLEEGPWSAQSIVDGMELSGSNPRAASTLLLRRSFDVEPHLKRATLFVCGLGNYTLTVNGVAVDSDNLLTPGWTEYTRTCLYDTHDLTSALRAGKNVIGLTLASGMYNVPSISKRYTKFVGPPRALKAIAQLRLEYTDGRIALVATDRQWKVASGPTVFAHAYGGEDYDARLEPKGWATSDFDDSHWTAAATTDGPGGDLRGISQAAPPIRRHETLRAVSTKTLRPGIEVYDFGQNAAIMPHLLVHGTAGTQVKIIPAELLKSDGTVDVTSTHPASTEAAWNYYLAGTPSGERWDPSFYYHGARYLQVERLAPSGADLPTVDGLTVSVVHSASSEVGHFATSNELFNRIHELVRWAQRSNMMSVLTDCPHRERLGWMEQYHLNGPSLRFEYDLAALYAKTFNDMVDAQHESGLLPSIAPEYTKFAGDFGDSPEWGSALILSAWQQFVWTGDEASLRRTYPAMQRYVDYLTHRASDGILSYGLGDWYDVGPKPPGYGQLTPIALTATAIYFEDVKRLEQIALHLGRADDAKRYDEMAQKIAVAFNAKFFDAAKGVYASGSQTADAMPLVVDLVPAGRRRDVLEALVRDVRDHDNGLTAGDVGYRYLLRALADNDRSDVIFELNNQSQHPGYGYQLAQGATSLTEAWNADRHSSQNHFMLGQIMEWFYHDLAGLAPDPNGPGFGRIVVRPQPVGDITWTEASVETVRGRAAVRWERKGVTFKLWLTVPVNSRASVQLPVDEKSQIRESNLLVDQQPGMTRVAPVQGRPTFEVGAGEYVFETK